VYRLPTEAEWEYACRAGTSTAYSFGDDPALLHVYGNYKDRAGGGTGADGEHSDGFKTTAPVGLFLPNPWGLYDMHGNVWEWCVDWYGPYAAGAVTDPVGPQQGSGRVGRGGCWNGVAGSAHSGFRYYRAPGYRYDYFGLRLALAPPVLEPAAP